MKNKLRNFICVLTASVFLLTGCETTSLDINENPLAITADSADPTYVLNGLYFNLAFNAITLSSFSEGIMRHSNLFGTYANSSSAGSMNGPWSNTYTIANNLNFLEGLNADNSIPVHYGIGQLAEVVAFTNLVDYIGTAVYSEAVSSEFDKPNLDSGQSIYTAMLAQLDEAITNINSTTYSSLPSQDWIYNGELDNWTRLANSLKIKLYVQARLAGDDWDGDGVSNTNAINSIVTQGNFIAENSQDFQILHSTSATEPDNRHPYFTANYLTGANGGYMSNDFMNRLLNGQTVQDPRTPYYFYRQTLEDPQTLDPDGDLLPCDGNADYNYCYLGNGYWGRDHADDEGIPNDGLYRTTYGIYPGGGAYDDGVGKPVTESAHIGGAGLRPMLLASYSHFWLAEAVLTMGVTGDARQLLEAGINLSFDKVADFAGTPMSAAEKLAYITDVLANYDAADDAGKLSVVIEQFYIASFGNSIEAYNNYRRTGYPQLSSAVITNTNFPRSYFLPTSELNSNDNPDLEQKELTDQVFWDTNPADFID